MSDVWVVRNRDGQLVDAATFEEQLYQWTLRSDAPYSIAVETLLTPEMAAVSEAAKAIVDVVHPPKIENYREYMAALDNLVAAVATLRALEGDA